MAEGCGRWFSDPGHYFGGVCGHGANRCAECLEPELNPGDLVTFKAPILWPRGVSGQRYARFLPGDRGYVVEGSSVSGRIRVRVPDTGEDGWVDRDHLVPTDNT